MLYDNGGLTRQATLNEKNAAAAQELADIKAKQQSQSIYDQGANDAYSAVERRLMEQAQAQQEQINRSIEAQYAAATSIPSEEVNVSAFVDKNTQEYV